MMVIFYILFAFVLGCGCGSLITLGFVAYKNSRQKKENAIFGLRSPFTGKLIDKDADLDNVWIKRDPEDGHLIVYKLVPKGTQL